MSRSSSRQIQVLLSDLAKLRHAAGNAVLMTYLLQLARRSRTVLRDRSLLPVDNGMPRRAYHFAVPGCDTRVRVDTSLPIFSNEMVFSGARELYCRRVYAAVPGFLVRPGETVIDLGANIGLFTTFAAICGAHVIAVEAQSGFLPCIYEHLRLNGVTGSVTVRHGVIAGEVGVIAGGPAAADHWGVDPPTLSMEELLDDERVARVGLLKIDIEGSEFGLLTADASWLNSVDRVVMEAHSEFGAPADIVRVLAARGFAVTALDQDSRPTDRITSATGYLFATRDGRA